jgi:hypothetical protein
MPNGPSISRKLSTTTFTITTTTTTTATITTTTIAASVADAITTSIIRKNRRHRNVDVIRKIDVTKMSLEKRDVTETTPGWTFLFSNDSSIAWFLAVYFPE